MLERQVTNPGGGKEADSIEFGGTHRDQEDQTSGGSARTFCEIIAVIEATDALKESPDYELYRITEQEPEVFERVVEQQIASIDKELTELKTEAQRLKREIVELSGEDAAVIG